MILHSVIVSYERPELTAQAIRSYQDTITLPATLLVVDNGSSPDVRGWLAALDVDVLQLDENRYPGYAANVGFGLAPLVATHLHRADNDFAFLPGWCDHVAECFEQDTRLGQLGLRTDEEEPSDHNVGGNMIVRREVWEAGVRYDERPWRDFPIGWTEDSYLSPAVVRAGWKWGRVTRPCIVGTSSEDPDDSYYRRTWTERGLFGTPGYPER